MRKNHTMDDVEPRGFSQRERGLRLELVRTALARDDFKRAKGICQRIAESHAFDDALWTALAVTYWRPFTKCTVGRLSEKRFERFDDVRLESVHRLLHASREARFAHNEMGPDIFVHASRPAAGGEDVKGDTSVTKVPFARDEIGDVERLCDLQVERAVARIHELTAECFGDRDWVGGTILHLTWPDLIERPV